ncbi:MAG TPA: peptidase, partial [Desulfobacterales bacterium]|nr:peptidase [Desulfobacterales bacterium]
DDEFFKLIFASKKGTGYVGEHTAEQNRAHFGENSLFAGINKSRGICDALISFDLNALPDDAIIKSAHFYLYPMNRVAAKIEKFGEWNLSLLKADNTLEVTDFDDVENADTKGVIGQAIQSSQLTQGIWNHWEFTEQECKLLQEEISNTTVRFRVDGPKDLPDGEDSQMMQFDIGYGKFGGGIHYRPILDIKYTITEQKIKLEASTLSTISIDQTTDELESGFDEEGNRVYGYMDFDLSHLPDPQETMIIQCALKIKNKNSFKKRSDVRYYIELVEVGDAGTYQDIKNRDKIEYIGYEVSESDLNSKEYQYFKFDTLSKMTLDRIHQEGKKLKLVIKPTSAKGMKSRIIKWDRDVKLVVKSIQKHRRAPHGVENLKISKENRMIKLSWDSVDDDAVNGYYVVRNSFHPPKHFMDGVKIYGGKDTYTYDNFASYEKEKYYSVFSYDDVPNFSESISVRYDPLEKY